MVDFSGIKNIVTKDNILSSLNSAWKTALFIEALRNLNWSRDYLWYVELDGVPSPFQRGGVLGLPCKSVSYNLTSESSSLEIHSMNMSTHVPQSAGSIGDIQLSLYDDEQGTLRQFFERWHNQVYNPYLGTLPVTESCKQLSIHYQKSTRRNIKRVFYSIDSVAMTNQWLQLAKDLGGSYVNQLLTGYNYLRQGNQRNKPTKRTADALEFLVYPGQTININLTSSGSLIELSITLKVAHFLNQDFGNPTENSGVSTILDTVIGDVTNGNSFLDKLADYI